MEPGAAARAEPKALIRHAAMAVFAEHGFRGASIRLVAAAAGVSPGLVQHHYRSKQRLRAAVDDFVLGQAADLTTSISQIQARDPVEFSRCLNTALAAFAEADPVLLGYLRRSLIDGGSSAGRLFDGLLAFTRQALDRLADQGLLREGLDPVWAPLHVLLLNIGPLLLHPHIDRHLDQPLLSSAGVRRWQSANATLGLRSMLAGPEPGPSGGEPG